MTSSLFAGSVESLSDGSVDAISSTTSAVKPDAARVATDELKLRVDLYKFYIDGYIKGITIFLGIQGALFTFAVREAANRALILAVAFVCCCAILMPLHSAFSQEKEFRMRFQELALLCGQKPIETSPLYMLACATTAFLMIVVAGWCGYWALF